MNNLAVCPFCKQLPTLEYGAGIKKYWYACNNPKCPCQPSTYAHSNKGVVKRAWNMCKSKEVKET